MQPIVADRLDGNDPVWEGKRFRHHCVVFSELDEVSGGRESGASREAARRGFLTVAGFGCLLLTDAARKGLLLPERDRRIAELELFEVRRGSSTSIREPQRAAVKSVPACTSRISAI